MGVKAMGSQAGGVQPHTLTSEGSLYSLTLDEVENQLGNLDKPLSCMNLDELLKTVWSAEAGQVMEFGVNKQPSQLASSSSVQWLPNQSVSRDLRNKTVNEVWKSIQHKGRKEAMNDKEKEPAALGEMTLEDFLEKAGIVGRLTRESCGGNLFGDDHEDEFRQQPHWMQLQLSPVACQQQLVQSISGFMARDRHLQQPIHSGVRPMLDVAYPDTQLVVATSPTRGTVSDIQTHGRKRVALVEKTVERRQKRMIKNRESAARSRARKQAYTNELENKISYLEEEIARLKKLQAVEKAEQCAPPPEPNTQLRRTNSSPL